MGNTAENARKTVSYAILVLAVLSLAYLAGLGSKPSEV